MNPEDTRKVRNGFVIGFIVGVITIFFWFPEMPLPIKLSFFSFVAGGWGCLGALIAAMFFTAEEH